ncbi:hypothetical protein CP532_0531 [Ophiocordyceps camponoti-leonardi (nom. inval.)]|nr:hypothetical protein CP532_0531 [Ophiocordyceps camponoti-leonardi (nom. inval.)]
MDDPHTSSPSPVCLPPRNMNGPLYMQRSGSNVVLVRRLRRKDDGPWRQLARWFVENQIGLSFNLLALLFLAHSCIPKARAHTRRFFHLSYYDRDSNKYGVGFDDVYYIIFCIVLFTGLRAATMEYLLAPFARLQGLTKRRALTRFSEQAWLFIYYSIFWSIGMYIYSTSPYFLNLRELWTGWPVRQIDGLSKAYILAQLAFWLQQMLVINIEDRRKDHWQMVTHHVITTGLIYSCYCYHHTRVGNLILVIMDVVDLFFPVAKCLKYTGHATLCDVAFGFFMLSWFVSRHIFYLMICWSLYAETPNVIKAGCYSGRGSELSGPEPTPSGFYYVIEPLVNAYGRVCHDEVVKWVFLAALLFLQVITLIWFSMIVRVAAKVIRGDGAEDTRSDDEDDIDEEEEDDEFVYEEARPLEEEVGVEALDLKGWERRTGVKRQASSSGVSLPGHSDRKELLGRIGCEKQVE